MNLSYSYYNQYNDPDDDMYNMAVALNNKNGSPSYFTTQGSFNENQRELIAKPLKIIHTSKHIEHISSEGSEEEINHIKKCAKCKRKFYKLLKKKSKTKTKHVFSDSDADSDPIKYDKIISEITKQIQPLVQQQFSSQPVPPPIPSRTEGFSVNTYTFRNILLIILIVIALLIVIDWLFGARF